MQAVVPVAGFRRARGPAWWTTTLPEELEKRPRDVQLIRAFLDGRLPRSEALAIIRDGKADWRVSKALRVWLAQRDVEPEAAQNAAAQTSA